jgi:NAD(P)-dependent dehydrogenase (short-subunit alcohol dehydrogenase family)
VRGAVVVTGASSGIGRACTVALAREGFEFFAGVRDVKDGQLLAESTDGRITPLLLDVTVAESVRAAAEQVADGVGALGLAALVNNAGIGVFGPVAALPVAALRRQYEVNVFGQVAVTQALLPLLRRSRGRIINVGSIGDRLTMPFGAALTSSKWALASITEGLRMELRPAGIRVILIEPASIHTEAVEKMEAQTEQTLDGFDQGDRERYGKAFRTMTRHALGRERAGSPPEAVARRVVQAITARRPRTRYLAGKHAHLLAALARWVPDRLFDPLRLKLFGLPRGFGGEDPEATTGGGVRMCSPTNQDAFSGSSKARRRR